MRILEHTGGQNLVERERRLLAARAEGEDRKAPVSPAEALAAGC